MHLLAVGLDQRTAPLALRERCVYTPADASTVLPALASGDIAEVALLCTCNRTEFYAAAPDPATAVPRLRAELARRAGLEPAALRDHLYCQVGAEETLRHLCRVASGLEALVLGETQVLGQVKDAYLHSAEAGTVGKYLHGCFHQALACAKRVHTETGLARHPVSVGAAAVDFARQALGELRGRAAVLVGAGETAETVARRLREAGFARIDIVGRSAARAGELALRVGGAAWGLDDLAARLTTADVLVTSTSAATPIVTAALLEPVLTCRDGRPLLIVDIAVPRDVDPAVGDLPGVRLCNIDDLQGSAAAGRRERGQEEAAAARIIEEGVAGFRAWLSGQDAVPVIRALSARFEAVAESEAERALRHLGALPPREREVVRQLAHAVARKLLDAPVRRLKDLAGTPGGHEAVRALGQAFELEVPSVIGLPTGGHGVRAAGG